jgi:hypothetical protein
VYVWLQVRGGVVAREKVQCYAYAAAVLTKLTAKHPELERAMWKSVGQQVAEEVLLGVTPFKRWPKSKLHLWLEKSTVLTIPDGERASFKGTVVRTTT